MANNSQVDKSTAALDEVKDTITKLNDENNSLKAKLKEYEDKQTGIEQLITTDYNRRAELRELAQQHHHGEDPFPLFTSAEYDTEWWMDAEKLGEERWFAWVGKELQFAKEMRAAYGRVAGQVEEPGVRKRKADDISSLSPA